MKPYIAKKITVEFVRLTRSENLSVRIRVLQRSLTRSLLCVSLRFCFLPPIWVSLVARHCSSGVRRKNSFCRRCCRSLLLVCWARERGWKLFHNFRFLYNQETPISWECLKALEEGGSTHYSPCLYRVISKAHSTIFSCFSAWGASWKGNKSRIQ